YNTYWDAVGAGPDVWTKISSGYFNADATGTVTLKVIAGELEAQLLYGGDGAEYPEQVSGDEIELTIVQP
ncbi:MAG: hypothetical protein QF662_05430, partial [Phycisphaerae bacterium]|nr:hypothetical protein [Phycisphaerae bacterium]